MWLGDQCGLQPQQSRTNSNQVQQTATAAATAATTAATAATAAATAAISCIKVLQVLDETFINSDQNCCLLWDRNILVGVVWISVFCGRHFNKAVQKREVMRKFKEVEILGGELPFGNRSALKNLPDNVGLIIIPCTLWVKMCIYVFIMFFKRYVCSFGYVCWG